VGSDLVSAIPNDTGIRLYGNGSRIGGDADSRVLASGNTTYGIFLDGSTVNNVVSGAIVGADLSGMFAIPNQIGIQDSGSGNTIGTEIAPPELGLDNRSSSEAIGKASGVSTVPPSGAWSNLVSGNTQTGITATGTTVIVRNYVGTDSSGSVAIGNGLHGIDLLNGSGHEVGRGSENGNLISGNGNVGLYFGPLVTDAAVAANFIGTDATGTSPLPNGAAGIRVDASAAVVIGGATSAVNVVAYNLGPGVQVEGTGSTDISRNAIFDNQGIGIDLGGDGVTPNDGGTPPDTDSGPNGLQNFPVMTSAIAGGISTWITFSLQSTPNTEFRYDIYSSDAPDPSGYGEGSVYVAGFSASTNASGLFEPGGVGLQSADAPIGSWVTVTATSPDGETSEFSNAFQVTGDIVSLASSKVFLEGPYAGGLMSTQLLTNGDIPLSQPYGDAQYNGTLQEFDGVIVVTTIPAGTVDWITISLRSSTSAASEVGRTVALLKSDGSITDTAGTANVDFGGVSNGSYYLVVCHRNHLCAMSSVLVDFSSGSGTWDFTTAMTQAYSGGGSPMKDLGDGSFGLFAADNNADGNVTAPDFNQWNAETTAGATGYVRGDHNLDSNVTAPDFNLWNANTTAGAATQVPD
jgi:hypothetical protein